YHERGMRYVEEAVTAARAADDRVLVAVAQFRLGIAQCYRGRIGDALEQTAVAMQVLDAVPDHALPDFQGVPGRNLSRQTREPLRASFLAHSGRWDDVFALLGEGPDTAIEHLASTFNGRGVGAVWRACAIYGHLAEARRAARVNIDIFVAIKDDLAGF